MKDVRTLLAGLLVTLTSLMLSGCIIVAVEDSGEREHHKDEKKQADDKPDKAESM